MKNKKVLIFSLIFILISIFYMSSQQGAISHNNSYEFVHKIKSISFRIYSMQDYELDYIVRKIAHVSEYTILSLVISMAILLYFKKSLSNTFLISVSCCFLYASTDELHQRFVAGREGCFKDVLIDSCGAIIGFVLAVIIYRVFFSRRGNLVK